MEKDNISFNEIYCNLRKITVSDRTKSKNGLDYLPWATAWDEICSHYNASYEFMTFDNSTTVVGVDSNGDKIMGGMDDPYLVTKAGLMVATSEKVIQDTCNFLLWTSATQACLSKKDRLVKIK